MEKWKGIIISESLKEPSIINKFHVYKVKVSKNEHDIDKYGNNYNIGSELFTWKEDKYNIITLKRAGTDTTLTLDTRITSDDIKVDCYSLIIPKSVTIDNLKYVQILTLKENKEPRALYNLLVKNGCFTYDKRF